jgi:outer membrane lipoprotein-sorting protein
MDWSSITRRLFLFLTGGLFAKIGLGDAAIQTDNPVLSAGAILERMETTYATCETYQDSGFVTTVFIRDDGQRRNKIPFSTAFVRPTRFRFEFKNSHDGQNWRRYIVWADGADLRTWWDIRPGVVQPPSLSLGLAGATGVSGGSAHTVPALLMPDSIGGRRLTDLTQLRRLEDAKLDGVDCFRIQGSMRIEIDPAELERRRQLTLRVTGRDLPNAISGPEMLWIDKSTFLLRRIDKQTQFDDFRTESTTIYEPLINSAIADSQLKFDPPEN